MTNRDDVPFPLPERPAVTRIRQVDKATLLAPTGSRTMPMAGYEDEWVDIVDYIVRTTEHSFTLPAHALAAGRRYMLDLGDVRELASVTINGKAVGTAWHAPYRLDATDAVRPGANVVRISVTNLWPNRLIGDRQPGATPIAFAPQSPYTASSALLPSGLLGPVRLLASSPR